MFYNTGPFTAVRNYCNFLQHQAHGANVIKLFMAVSYDFSKYVNAFVPGKPFQPTLIFSGKVRAYPIEATFGCSTLG